MKKRGCYFYLEKERNKDLIRAFSKVYSESSDTVNIRFYAEISNQPSKRFWVSEERASIVISKMLKGDTLDYMIHTKREMFKEIYKIYQSFKSKYPHLLHFDLVSMAVNHKAPKFYLTPGTVKEIIYRIKRQWYNKQEMRYK